MHVILSPQKPPFQIFITPPPPTNKKKQKKNHEIRQFACKISLSAIHHQSSVLIFNTPLLPYAPTANQSYPLIFKISPGPFLRNCGLQPQAEKLWHNHVRIQRRTGVRTPLQSHKAVGFLSNVGIYPMEMHKAAKPTFNAGLPGKRHLYGVSQAGRRWPAFDNIWTPTPLIN